MSPTAAFRVFGIPVVLSPSWFVIATLITLSLRATFERANPSSSSVALWGAAALASVLFFAGVVLHEASHSVMARRLGLGVSSIRLFVFGGVSQLEEEPRSAREELLVTVVGPLSSVVLGLVFFGAAAVAPGPALVVSILDWLGWVNLGLGLFNLLPGFPMDGGRVLRALVWRWTGSLRRATRVAAASGRVVSALLVATGVWMWATRGLTGLWLVFIGVFLWQAASVAESPAATARRGRGTKVRAAMEPRLWSASPALPLDQLLTAADGAVGDLHPVVDPWGRAVGVVSLTTARRVPPAMRGSTTVASVMRRIAPGDLVGPEEDLESVLREELSGSRVFLVVEPDGVVGILVAGEALESLPARG
jgi:Zn-dependent protease